MEREKPSFYAVLPADVRYAENLTSLQKLLYAEITALSNKEGYCFASNGYFSELYKKEKNRISKQISDLEKKGYLKITVEKEDGNSRKIFIGKIKKLKKEITTIQKPIEEKNKSYGRKKQEGMVEKNNPPIGENYNHNITSNNTTRNNTLSSNEDNILTDTEQKKNSDLKISSIKILEEEKEKSSAKKEKEIYGNLEINEAMDLIKSYNGGIVNGSDGRQRQYANHLIKKLKKLTSVQEGKFTWEATLEMILKIISENEYHSAKIASPELIYRNLASLMQICKSEFQKRKPIKTIKTL